MISGGSGITPFVSIIREIIFRITTVKDYRTPNLFLIAASKILQIWQDWISCFLHPALQLTYPHYNYRSKLKLPEKKKPHHKLQIQTKWFKPDASDTLISSVLGENSRLWLRSIISSSFIMFLLFTGDSHSFLDLSD
ncbi:hypothetical protein M9H77_26678 [Catharanthus roseus]|uniref:Uncharacterized protein n=1 Tax=Catharanthus roseus TaxID=4058 RepID=A0ACC0ABW7_CATRO|nr:hypothetical protein M9H77_26678 [Catharanthus roseus]